MVVRRRPGLTRVSAMPAPYVDGWSFRAPVVEMPVYLRWLADQVVEAGGTITRMALGGLPDQAEVVVNASGLGARLIGSDPSVLPVRGQVVHVEQFGLDRWWPDGAGPTYVVPRSKDVAVGGTDEEGEWSRTPDPATAARILERASLLVPELATARVLRHRVGLRPARPRCAWSEERCGDARVVHCYGHGGAGVTLSWGCADEVRPGRPRLRSAAGRPYQRACRGKALRTTPAGVAVRTGGCSVVHAAQRVGFTTAQVIPRSVAIPRPAA